MLEFQLDGRDVGVDGLIKQAGLRRVKVLAASAELAKSFNTAISCVSWSILAWRYRISRSFLVMVFACSPTWAINSVTISRSSCAFRFVSESGARTMPCSVPVSALSAYACMPE